MSEGVSAQLRLRELRMAKNLSQEDLAAMIDMDKSTVSRAENGSETTKLATLVKCAEAIGVRIAMLFAQPDALSRLAATVEARRGADPESSWTAKLLAKGPEKCAEKFGEEAVEAIIEAVKGDRARLVSEAADVLYHLVVMLAARGVTLAEVEAELERREGTSGIAEKAGR